MVSPTIVTGRSRRVASRFGPGTPNGVVVDTVYRTQNHSSTDSRSGQSNPGWRKAIAERRQAGSPYNRSAGTYGFVTGNITGSYFEDVGKVRRTEDRLFGQLFLDNHPSLPAVPTFPNMDVNARINFISKCRKTMRSFQGGVFLGELKETINMIARPGSALRHGISAYLSDVKRNVRRAPYPDRSRILTKTWLEYSYGWRPLIRDIEQGVEALSEVSHYIPDIIVGVAREDNYTAPVTLGTTASGSFMSCLANFNYWQRGSVRYLGCVAWESDNRAKDWKSNWGLTVSDFYPTVWNLIPYSFIVDYFSNVGEVIDASAFGLVSLRWGVRSEVRNSSCQMGNVRPLLPASASVILPQVSANLSLSQLSSWSFLRTLVSSVDVNLTDIRLKVPGVSDWRKWANLSALAIERLF